MSEQMPSFLQPSSNGSTETKRYDRLYYKIQPEPHFALKKGDSDIAEKISFEKLGLDLSNMNIGYVKWIGTTPTKVMENALASMPRKPQGAPRLPQSRPLFLASWTFRRLPDS